MSRIFDNKNGEPYNNVLNEVLTFKIKYII